MNLTQQLPPHYLKGSGAEHIYSYIIVYMYIETYTYIYIYFSYWSKVSWELMLLLIKQMLSIRYGWGVWFALASCGHVIFHSFGCFANVSTPFIIYLTFNSNQVSRAKNVHVFSYIPQYATIWKRPIKFTCILLITQWSVWEWGALGSQKKKKRKKKWYVAVLLILLQTKRM